MSDLQLEKLLAHACLLRMKQLQLCVTLLHLIVIVQYLFMNCCTMLK